MRHIILFVFLSVAAWPLFQNAGAQTAAAGAIGRLEMVRDAPSSRAAVDDMPLRSSQMRAAVLHAVPAFPLPAGTAVRHRAAKGTSTAWMIVGGLAGGAVGIAALGALDLYRIRNTPPYEEIAIPVGGILAGDALGIPLGVHLANGRSGSFLAVLGYSALIGLVTAGAGILVTAWSKAPYFATLATLVAVPAAQVAASIHGERTTAGGESLF